MTCNAIYFNDALPFETHIPKMYMLSIANFTSKRQHKPRFLTPSSLIFGAVFLTAGVIKVSINDAIKMFSVNGVLTSSSIYDDLVRQRTIVAEDASFSGGRLFIMSLSDTLPFPCTKFSTAEWKDEILSSSSSSLTSSLCVPFSSSSSTEVSFLRLIFLLFIFSSCSCFSISSSLISLMISIAIVTKSFSFMDRLFITRIPILIRGSESVVKASIFRTTVSIDLLPTSSL
ncbi:hypothetical protein AWRI1631_45410 [Saccharomyces cerevisiae AWRI1631]|uniref:Transmembrane protein n=1 Tax=Saccharomyces cerevisiae (strain AWRI1631) TaxID=545124 RepID=B5VGK6_YEAS6|nr:hypothetical protein AWRI1631_45410 [Saccharomyces cerevisiae AWRI1631]